MRKEEKVQQQVEVQQQAQQQQAETPKQKKEKEKRERIELKQLERAEKKERKQFNKNVVNGLRELTLCTTMIVKHEEKERESIRFAELETRTIERQLKIQDLQGQSFLLDGTIGQYLYEQQQDFQTNRPKESDKLFRAFVQACGIADFRTAERQINKYIFLSKIPDKHKQKLASFLSYQTIKVLDAMESAPKGKALELLSKKFETIRSANPEAIEKILNQWTRTFLAIPTVLSQKKIRQYIERFGLAIVEYCATKKDNEDFVPGVSEIPNNPNPEPTTNKNFIPVTLQISHLNELDYPEQRFDNLLQHIEAMSELLKNISDEDYEGFQEYVPHNSKELLRAALSGLKTNCDTLRDRLLTVKPKSVAA